ncbi:hypothetical protein G9Q84_10505 [Pseudomonas sp. P7]|nr:hypothetical protein [Pseudomonas sivasensis]
MAAYQGTGLYGMISALSRKCTSQTILWILPVPYVAGLFLCAVFVPFKPFHFEQSASFYVPVLWMGLPVPLLAILLMYRMRPANTPS